MTYHFGLSGQVFGHWKSIQNSRCETETFFYKNRWKKTEKWEMLRNYWENFIWITTNFAKTFLTGRGDYAVIGKDFFIMGQWPHLRTIQRAIFYIMGPLTDFKGPFFSLNDFIIFFATNGYWSHQKSKTSRHDRRQFNLKKTISTVDYSEYSASKTYKIYCQFS